MMIHRRMRVQEDKLIEKWHDRQLDLANLLQTFHFFDDVPHVDWRTGQIKWAKDGYVVRAKLRQLCRYSPTYKLLTIVAANNSNGSLLPTNPERQEESDQNGAWLWAIHIAEMEKAQYLYRLRQSHVVLFVGLWDIEVINDQGGEK